MVHKYSHVNYYSSEICSTRKHNFLCIFSGKKCHRLDAIAAPSLSLSA